SPPLKGRGGFDPDPAMRFLKFREEKKRRRDRQPGGEAWREQYPEPNVEEVRETILSRLDAISRHEEPKKIAQGWSKDEDGYMIPPGWVRAQPLE
ncbi:MAG TPA: hypothetical protein VGR19_05430, partial [Allosphingosinicella sp.]|nr:hypothetical protein [Allosphingosinicella sp.]